MGLLDEAIREHLDLKRKRGDDPGEIERLEREALGPVRHEPHPQASEPLSHLDVHAEDELIELHESGDPPLLSFEHESVDLIDEPAEEPAPAPKRGFLRRYRSSAPSEDPLPAAADEHQDQETHPYDEGHDVFDDHLTSEHAPEPFPHDPIAEPQPPVEPVQARPSFEEPPPKRPRFSPEPPAPPAVEPEPEAAVDETPQTEETTEWDVEHAFASGGVEEAQPSEAADDSDEDVLEETPEFLQDTPDHDRLWFEQRPPKDFDFDG